MKIREVKYIQRVIIEIQNSICPFCQDRIENITSTCQCGAGIGEVDHLTEIKSVAYRDFPLDRYILAEVVMEDRYAE